jgi:WD40 repeat protein
MFCDGKLGTIISTFEEHHADVLQIVTNAACNKVFSTGVDPKIAMFERQKDGSFVISKGKRPFYHDTHALALFQDNYIIAGALCGRVAAFHVRQFFNTRAGDDPFTYMGLDPAHPILHFADTARLLLVDNNDYSLSLLRLPLLNKNPQQFNNYAQIPIDENPESLLRISTKSNGGWAASSSAISDNGKYICYTTPDSIFLVKVSIADDQLAKVDEEVDLTTIGIEPGNHVAFSGNNILIVVSRHNNVQLVDISKRSLLQTLESKQYESGLSVDEARLNPAAIAFRNRVCSVYATPAYLAIAYPSDVHIFKLDNASLQSNKPYWTLKLKDIGIVYRMGSFRNLDDQLFILSTGNNLSVMSLAKKQLWTTSFSSDKFEFQRGPTYALGLSGEKYLVGNHYTLRCENEKQGKASHLILFKGFTFTLSCIQTGSNELALVYMDWASHLTQLPEVCYRHRYAT